MKKLKNTIKMIATLGLTVVLLTNSFPAAAFAAEIDGTEPAIVMDEELPESSEEVSAGESGEGASDKVLSEGSEEINGKDAAGENAEGNSNDQLSDKGSSDEENDTTGDAVTPSYEMDEDADKDSNEDNEEYPAFDQSKSIDGVKVSVTADEGVFPEGATLSVEKVTNTQKKQAEEAVEDKRPDAQNVAASYTYDIQVLDEEGNEIEPADSSKVKVSFKLEEVADDNLTTNVYHITEDTEDEGSGELVAEKLPVETDGDTATAETDGFSLYTVEFTYNDLQYVLPGDSEVELSEILGAVGLYGEVTEVSVSDSSLFSVAKNDSGEWIVTAHKDFSTDEWMKVTINDVVYEITVTDDPSVVASGNCGITGHEGDVTWMLDNSGTLTISGTGAMAGYENDENRPWNNKTDSITSVVIGSGVTNIGDNTFPWCTNLTSVTIPVSVTTIGENAFNGCSQLGSVTIPGNVTTIGDCAFYWCTNLTSVTIPASVTTIGSSAFSVCESMTEISVDSGNSTYSSENGVLFDKDKTTLICYPAGKTDTSYSIPDTVTNIARYAFNYCAKLDSVTIGNNIETIGVGAFSNCTGLTSVDFGNNVTTIDSDAFYKCSKLGSVIIPASVTTIGSSAFSSCKNLTSVTIPASVTTIGSSAFSTCTSITSVTASAGLDLSDTSIRSEAQITYICTAPTAPTKTTFVYNGSEQTFELAAGSGYALSGNTATNAGSYTATATLTTGDNPFYVWGNTTTMTPAEGEAATEAKSYSWSITAKPVTVTADDAGKTYGESDPDPLAATVTGLVGTDTLTYFVSRAEGESAGTYTITPNGEAEQGNYTVTYKTGTFTISRKTVIVKADDKSKTFGENNPELTATVTGLVGSDTLTYAVSRTDGENVGSYAITPTGDATQGNYTVIYETGTFTINKVAAPTLNGANKPTANELTYNGGDQALVTAPTTLLGSGYTLKYSLDGTNWSENIPTGKNGTSYTVKAKYFGDNNREDSAEVDISVTIAKKGVTVTAKDQSVEVGGSIATGKAQAELSDAVSGHTLSAVTLTASSTDAVTTNGTITPSDAKIMDGTTDVTGNYNISYTNGTLTVTNVQVYISGVTASNKTYDGTESATITGTAVLKKVNGDAEVSGLTVSNITAAFADKNVGTGKTVTISAATLSDATNYTLNIEKSNQELGLTASITAKSVTITGVTATTRDYDPDDLTVTLSGGEVSGKVGSEVVTVDLSAATGTMTDANAGTDKAVTVTGVKLGGANAGNYTLSAQPTGVKVTINKAAYTGTKAASATVRSGQVTADATLTLPVLPDGAAYASTGTVGGITVALISGTPSVSGRTLTFSTTNQENDTSATITIAVTGATNYNDYSVAVTVTAKDKDEAGVTINGGADKTVTYGAADFSIAKTVTNAGTGTGEWTWTSSEPSVAVIGEHTGTITIKKVGTTTIKAKYESETTIGEAEITLTVDPKTLGISWSNTSIPYDGKSHVPTVSKTGVETGDDCTVDVSGAMTNAGSGYTATASLSGADAGNYTLPENKKSCSFSITKAALTVTAKPKTITYGSAPANDGVTYSGFVNDETTSVLKGALAYDYNYSQYGNVGSYSITPKGLTADNYTISFVSGTLTVVQKEVGLTWSNTPLTFNGSAQAPTATATGLVNNDTVSVTVTGAQTNAGTGYTATASGLTGTKAGNYKLPAADTTTFSIDRASHEDGAASGELKYGMSGSVALSSLIEPGGSLGAVTVTDTNAVLDGTPALSGCDLGFSFVNDPDKVGKSATVEIPVTGCTNYLDYKIVVIVTVINCAHEHTEIRDAKVATCIAQGYTGDTYCTECGSKLESGSPIPIDPDNHSYDGGVITKQPTILSEGVKTYTCTLCNQTYTETVPRVDDGEDHSDLIKDVTDNDGKTKAEVKTEEKEDGSTETTVTVGGQEVEKTVKDADGNETVQTSIWIGGLNASYHYTGAAIKPVFHVYDGTKKLKSGTDYSVSYKNNTKVGTSATITISFKGNYKETAQEKVKFAIIPAVLGEDVKALDLAVAGTGKLQKPAPTVVWTSTGKTVSGKNFNFAYKDAAGNDVSGVKGEGTYTVTVTPKNGSFTGSMSATITVTSKKLLLSKASVTLKPNKYTYTGDPIIPASGTYTLKLNGATLTENTDYVVASVTNNINAGTATITFAAKEGNAAGYAGTKSATFKIVKGRELKQGDGFTYSYSSSVPYAKGGAKPSVVVKDGEDTLVLNKDYTVSYSKNTAVTNGATAIMTVKGKGNYKGSVKLYYAVTTQNIANLKDGITVADKPESKKGYKNPSVTIIDLDGKKLKSGTDFKIGTDYSEPDADGKVTVTVFGNGKYNGSIQVSYRYIKAAQQLSKVKSMKSISAQTYTGKAIRLKTADLTGILYVGNKKSPTYLVPGTDFVVLSYSNNTKAGTAKVTLKGMGNYGGTRTLTFKIKQKKGDYKGSLVDGEWKE